MDKISNTGDLGIVDVPKKYRVGYWISAKKLKKLNFQDFQQLCIPHGIELVPLDLDKDLDTQGPFHAVIHKLSDIWTLADQGHPDAATWLNKLKIFLDSHSDLPLIDPLSSVRLLCDRNLQYTFMKEVCQANDSVLSPPFVVLNDDDECMMRMKMSSVKFPVVCKPLVAHGSSIAHQVHCPVCQPIVEAHKMCLVFNESGMRQVSLPCVAQSFIPHNAVLYKVFVIGKRHFIIARPSLKNFETGDSDTIFFDSHEISKMGCESELTELDEPIPSRLLHAPSETVVADLVERIEKCGNLSLFGVDLIMERNTNNCFVIDVNAFPGYDGVPYFFDHLLELLKDRLMPTNTDTRLSLSPPPIHFRSNSDTCEYRGKSPATDSGIGSGTSDLEISDSEKKWRKSIPVNQTGYFPDWNRIKRFYGIPKPTANPVQNEKETKQEESSENVETKSRSGTIP